MSHSDHSDETDSDYRQFLAEYGAGFYEDYEDNQEEVIDPTISDANSAITVNNIPPCSHNVYYETFTTLANGHQNPESHVFEFSIGHLNRSTPTQIVSYVFKLFSLIVNVKDSQC
jgi:hypothetical protein